MIGYRVRGGRTDLGKLGDLLFDTGSWFQRYWVINCAGHIDSRDEVFVPIGLTDWVDHALREIILSVPMELVEKSPDLRENSPGSQWPGPHYSEHYRWPFFWTGAGTLGTASIKPPSEPIRQEETKLASKNLYSSAEILRYRVFATDGLAGYVEDLFLDDQVWSVRYVSLTPRRWWPTRATAITPHWISSLSWQKHAISLNLKRETVLDAPRFESFKGMSPKFEESLLRYYAGDVLKKAA